jgi:hypothetical protein
MVSRPMGYRGEKTTYRPAVVRRNLPEDSSKLRQSRRHRSRSSDHHVVLSPGRAPRWNDQSVTAAGANAAVLTRRRASGTMAVAMSGRELNLEALNALLQSVRRNPNDRPLRCRAADQVAVLANHTIASDDGVDRLLADAIVGAKLLRRALERSNKAEQASADDIAAINAWIDRLQTLLLKIIERPVRY